MPSVSLLTDANQLGTDMVVMTVAVALQKHTVIVDGAGNVSG